MESEGQFMEGFMGMGCKLNDSADFFNWKSQFSPSPSRAEKDLSLRPEDQQPIGADDTRQD